MNVNEIRSVIKQETEWVPYQGPEGGEGWQNTESGEVVYDDEPPGDADIDPDAYHEADADDLRSAVEAVTGGDLGEEWEQMTADEIRQAIQEMANPNQLAEVMEELDGGDGDAEGSEDEESNEATDGGGDETYEISIDNGSDSFDLSEGDYLTVEGITSTKEGEVVEIEDIGTSTKIELLTPEGDIETIYSLDGYQDEDIEVSEEGEQSDGGDEGDGGEDGGEDLEVSDELAGQPSTEIVEELAEKDTDHEIVEESSQLYEQFRSGTISEDEFRQRSYQLVDGYGIGVTVPESSDVGQLASEMLETKFEDTDPAVINSGDCYTFAWAVQDKATVDVDVIVNVDAMGEENAHFWVYYDGKHYDAEHPEGVEDWKDLSIWQRGRANLDNYEFEDGEIREKSELKRDGGSIMDEQPVIIDLNKQGIQDISDFAALAAETPPPTRQEAEGDIYEVEDPENLPNAAKNQRHLALVNEKTGEKVFLNAWIANDDESRYAGLSDKTDLDENSAMLFDWNEIGINSLVMRDMDFPIDIIFLDDYGFVQQAHSDVPPSADESFSAVCRYAIEASSGIVDRYGIDSDWRAYLEQSDATAKLHKDRVYVDDPAEVPSGASLQEGEQGGLYYETGEHSEFAQFQIETDVERMREYDFTDEQIEEAAEVLQDVHQKAGQIFDSWMNIATELGDVTSASHRTKSIGSAMEKVYHRQPDEYDSVSELTDLHGSMITVESVEDSKRIAEAIQEQADVVKVNNYYEVEGQPYRAVNIKANVDGVVAELQIKQEDLKKVGDASHSLVLKPDEEAPIDEMETLDTVPEEDLQNEIEDCLTQQADFIEGKIDDVNCGARSAEIIEEYYSLKA